MYNTVTMMHAWLEDQIAEWNKETMNNRGSYAAGVRCAYQAALAHLEALATFNEDAVN